MPRAITWCIRCRASTQLGALCGTCTDAGRSSDPRPSASRRGYGPGHRRRRRAYLAKHPICQHTAADGRYDCPAAARELDHVIPLSQGGADDETNYQGLCKPHHSSKTAVQSSGWGRPS